MERIKQHHAHRALAGRISPWCRPSRRLVRAGLRAAVVELEALVAQAEDVLVSEAVEGLHAVLAVEGDEPGVSVGVGADGRSVGSGSGCDSGRGRRIAGNEGVG